MSASAAQNKSFNGFFRFAFPIVAVFAIAAGASTNALAGNYNQKLLQECQRECTTILHKDQKYCKDKFGKSSKDEDRERQCIKNARDDQDRCDKSCNKKYGKQ